MKDKLELDLLKQKVLIIQSITDCSSELQLGQYIRRLAQLYQEKEQLDKFHKTDIEPAKLLEH